MTRIFLILSALILMGAQASAAEKTPQAVIQYVGAISINPSQDEKVLADWYGRLGIQTQEMKDGYFGTFQTVAGPFFFGIHRRRPDAPAKSSGSMAVVFSVSDYDLYLANAAKNNVFPKSTEPPSALGRFAYFFDPDGNEVTIWGK
jgi:predicted enzyme related to lactoylglutathione lyase